MSKNLLPCPFCGNDVMLHRIGFTESDVGYHIVCPCCDMRSEIYDTEQEVIDFWNCREPGWISVCDDLPEEKGEYIVAYHPCHWDDVKTAITCVGLDSYRGGKIEPTYKRWAKRKYQRVTHWMPKPKPPQEGGEVK